MNIVDYVEQEKQTLKEQIKGFPRKPVLLIIQANDDPASDAYIRGKIKDGTEIGVEVRLLKLAPNVSQKDLLSEIKRANQDTQIDGIIVQMPLAKHIDEEVIKHAVCPSKDVDGFHPLTKFSPCTPQGIIDYLVFEQVELRGKNAVVIGRSNIVGKPMAKLLLEHDANVTVLHSKTSKDDMDFYLAHADIIVVAVGRPYFIKDQTLKKDAVVIDVGINRVDGVLVGDAYPHLNVRLQTPVPKGVGLLTRLRLQKNLVEAYVRKQ
jgi:methylenetetrahydrofolate dehydrogenase (NADP+)/methenyltetrahydrofolate cyclohydrolase